MLALAACGLILYRRTALSGYAKLSERNTSFYRGSPPHHRNHSASRKRMGFHVRLDDDSRKLVEFVSTDPSKLLGKLYAAYMLFLVAEPDQAELKWLLDNAKALDSLTGDDIAYAVFAERFKIKLETDEYNPAAPGRRPRNVGQASVADINTPRGVTRLVKDGTFGMVVDGDELTAITYGTDRVARDLGIIDKLPCLVVIDAVPSEDLCVIHLDEQLTGSLMQLLRKSIAQFSVDGGSKKLKAWAEEIIRLQDLIASENAKAEKLQKEIDAKTFRISQMTKAIASGSAQDSPQVRDALQKFIDDRQALQDELERFPQTRDERLGEIDQDLEDLLIEYQRHTDLRFSTIFKQQVRGLGLHSKLAAGKATTMGYIGSFLKPDTLLKGRPILDVRRAARMATPEWWYRAIRALGLAGRRGDQAAPMHSAFHRWR
jgi:hypothetical protein